LIGRKRENLIVGWCGRFLFFVVPRQFSQDIDKWPENQILIPDWAYFYCPGATLLPTRQQNKNRPHQPTINFTGFLPINFLPLPAPPYFGLFNTMEIYGRIPCGPPWLMQPPSPRVLKPGFVRSRDSFLVR